MGFLPQLSAASSSARRRITVRSFGGLNHSERARDGQYFDCMNVSTDEFPVMTVRKRRSRVAQLPVPINGHNYMPYLIANDHLAWMNGDTFTFFGKDMFNDSLLLQDQPCGVVSVRYGAYIVTFIKGNGRLNDGIRRGIIYNTQDDTIQQISNESPSSSPMLGIRTISYDINGVEIITNGSVTPHDRPPMENDSGEADEVWLYATETAEGAYIRKGSEWVACEAVIVLMGNLFTGFNKGDFIDITCADSNYQSLNCSTNIVHLEGSNAYIKTPKGFISEYVANPSVFINGSIRMERKLPEIDFICEYNNRLFACNKNENSIFACRLGDAKNWFDYSGISSASYSAAVGTAGEFTGCASFRNSVLFFKEECIHVLTGTRPANYRIDVVECDGLERGAERSIAMINETLYYKSSAGIMAYRGNMPMLISQELGEYNHMNCTCAGTDGRRYYACLGNEVEGFSLFVYDTYNGVWTRESLDDMAFSFATLGDALYMLDGSLNIYKMNGDADADYYEAGFAQTPRFDYSSWEEPVLEAPVKWQITSGLLLQDIPNAKYISNLMLRMQSELGSNVTLSAMYDESGEFTELKRMASLKTGTCRIAVIPKRCDTMRLKISGAGEARLYSSSKVVEVGSDF